jgi:hypothetical protein
VSVAGAVLAFFAIFCSIDFTAMNLNTKTAEKTKKRGKAGVSWAARK